MRLLAIETAVEACSVALWQEGLVCCRFVHAPRQQTVLLLPMIEALMDEAGWSMSSLDTLAYSAGPGAFSGVRLGAAAVQGLALGLDKPVVAVSYKK
ncbi:MAG: tRNA (adenosine(37)-N6)-threonylcarbamoyltransferase complex dimerization subunit type 1 TsaB, partial [Pseudomonadales bacterium]|nr:tRNA (adenosine(37)-N6)-threonylcarbamoyltransferase complex dimerization subunit type 1 TsaB [Pseudomonadales bacterium]